MPVYTCKFCHTQVLNRTRKLAAIPALICTVQRSKHIKKKHWFKVRFEDEKLRARKIVVRCDKNR